MTTNDARQRDEQPTAALTTARLTPAPLAGTTPGSESLTGAPLPATTPTTTRPDLDDDSAPDVTAELELAVELADELATTLERNSTLEPGHRDTDRAAGASRTAPVRIPVDAGEVLARFGVDGWAEYNQTDERIRALQETLGPQHPRTRASMADRDAVDALSQQDEKTYQDALVAALEQVASERGIDIEVLPERMAPARSADAPEAESPATRLLAAAVRRAVLPQLGRAPGDLAETEIAEAVRQAGRTYLERIRTHERPVPVVSHDRLEVQLRTELQADELMPDEPVPPADPHGTDGVVRADHHQ
ncbi:hypothetical protein [Promicromonospora sp. NPDC059942]|uniref:hypothetical protein n=1 Tax=Promicromonospora sp. NPDC059942 TaxID=3347009 RepID=UPI0036526405